MSANKHTRPLTTAFLIASLIIPGPLTGCASINLYKPQRSKTQREAAAVTVKVTSVATWASMVDKLQPNFPMTETEALAGVIRDSRRTSQDTKSAIGAKGVYGQNEDGAPTPDVSTGLLGTTPAPPTLGVPTYPYEGRSPQERPDPMLELSAAKSLYQEVQMVNSYVEDAVMKRGHRAYVVRLLVTVLPTRRHSPYDVMTEIAFFSPFLEESEAGAGGAGGIDTAPGLLVKPSGTRLRETVVDSGEGPTVLPLFATDNLEATFGARSAESMLSLSAALTDVTGGITKGLGADAFSSAAQSQVYGRDLNALLTMGSLSANTLIVRLGATQETTADHAMTPRTHALTVLLTVPIDAPPVVEVTMVTRLTDTETGEVLRATTDKEIQGLYDDLREDFGLELDTTVLETLRETAQRNHYNEFVGILRRAAGDDHNAVAQAQALWVALVHLTAGSQYAGDRFELEGHGPLPAEVNDLFLEQTLILKDDGFTSAEVTIKGIELLEKVTPVAGLRIEGEFVDRNLPGTWVQPLDGEANNELTFRFDSPAMLGLIREDGTIGPMDLVLILQKGDPISFKDLLYQLTGGIPN